MAGPIRELRRRKSLTAAVALLGVMCMIGMVGASVPFYRWFCQATGYGGTPQIAADARLYSTGTSSTSSTSRDAARVRSLLTIRFDANTNKDLPWSFTALQRQVTVRPGEQVLAVYIAHNKATVPITGTATFNVTPAKAGQYFTKIACFCFTEQTLLPGQTVEMPVTFVVDPAIATDPLTSELTTLTLSYTFFRSPDSNTQS